MTTVLVPIANGSEDIEAITIIDVLRRGGAEVTVASVHEEKQIQAANGTNIVADLLLTDVAEHMYDAIVLPGGMPGAEHLRDCKLLIDMLEKHDIQDALLAADPRFASSSIWYTRFCYGQASDLLSRLRRRSEGG